MPWEVTQRFGVPAEILVSIWGNESSFGQVQGNKDVIRSLATLAFDGRRRDWAEDQLKNALDIVVDGRRERSGLLGSWAGAMGQPQFTPSSYLKFAVSHSGGGQPDIWRSSADALASIANYFTRNGWRAGEPWGLEVTPPAGFTLDGADTQTRRPMSDFARMGFRIGSGGPLPTNRPEAQIVLPSRGSGQVFLGHHNLRVIRRYNSPVNYGLAVGMLSDRIAAG